ncbi:MAG: phosphoadenosine phosphosulfate reductase family protein, partial [Candidatus Thermoplasmatota archaeon]|nr:phosphoadenosine phosphosulfate reductase family protein [Candidatus Thermoplasmatota archaeon]
MSRIKTGHNTIRWCASCNTPLLGRTCGKCHEQATYVSLTPPGDARPGFEHDRLFIWEIADKQFGEGSGEALLPCGHLFLLNRAPDEDRMDEIICDGMVVASIRYLVPGGWKLLLRPAGAARIAPLASRGVVVADEGAVAPVLEGKNLLAPGVIGTRGGILAGDEVIVVDPQGLPIATGSARQPTPQLVEGRGQGIKVRWKGREEPRIGRTVSWAEVLEANRAEIDRLEQKGVRFIGEVMAKNPGLPVAVSISGGKDSLATLLVTLAAGLKPKLLFADTGLEFDETLQNVASTAEEHGLELLVEHANQAFWEGLEIFGPPAKDFRWCCKSCKLGPATRLINQHFPQGVLSFIGQRAHESQQRANKGSVWRNPWVPNQVGASPIQNWSALHVWLYIFYKKARYNPLYEKGLHRVGCWLCPSSDIGDSDMAQAIHPDGDRWRQYLEEYARCKGLPPEWVERGLWRWKKPPSWASDMVPENARLIPSDIKASEGLVLVTAPGYQPCTSGVSVEGVFNTPLNLGRVANQMQVLGPVRVDEKEGWAETSGGKIQVFGEGGLVVKAESEEEAKILVERVRKLVQKAMLCIGCGVCLGACNSGAISLQEVEDRRKAVIDPELCTH